MLFISLRPNGGRAVIVGGGNAAVRKAESLADAGFAVFVVAEHLDERLRSMLGGGGTFIQRRYQPGDLQGATVVIAATDDPDVNARVVADARNAHALVCDASDPQRGDFTMTATARIGELTIAVDSGGAAPAFARRVAGELARSLDARYGDAVAGLARMREYVRRTFEIEERAPILRALAQRPVDELATMPDEAICATRESALALIQSRAVAARLAERGISTTLLGITTAGDRDRRTPIDRLGSANVFVTELENALRERRADFAVHSCKDLAGTLPDDMRIAAFSSREDPRDAFCSERFAGFESLPTGAVVGTSSPRRRSQLAALRDDLRYVPVRGNVDTRLRKLADGEYDAIVVAMAGLNRLKARAAYVVPFAADAIVPAAGQGALAVETLAAGARFATVLYDAVNDRTSELCVRSERAALRALRAGCSAPLGIHASLHGEHMTVDVAYEAEPGTMQRVRASGPCATAADAEALGAEAAQRLQASAAAEVGR